MIHDEFIWSEKYRPKTVAECILPDSLKKIFQGFVDQKNVPNLVLNGRPGVGKTTTAIAMLEEIEASWIKINGSLDAGIDVLRNEVQQFASTVSLHGTSGRKFVIFDEADYLNPNSIQPALRGFMQDFSRNCGFIFTCNKKGRLIDAIADSRCSTIDFEIPIADKPKLAAKFGKRAKMILEAEGIEYDSKVLVQFIMKYFPDCRKILNELQMYSASGKIDSGLLVNLKEIDFSDIIEKIKDKNFTELRKWASENSETDQQTFFKKLYFALTPVLTPASLARVILIINQYDYRSAFVASKEINIAACLTEVMVNAEFNNNNST